MGGENRDVELKRPATGAPGFAETERPVLECSGLVRRFGDRAAVDGIGFAIEAGQTYGLLRNGAGMAAKQA